MASNEPPRSNLPASMGPGARPLQPGESPGGLLKEITGVRSHYNIHVGSDAVDISYELKGQYRHFKLPFDHIPATGWTKSVCWGSSPRALISGTMLIDIIRGIENTSGRRVTQREAESIALHTSKRTMTIAFAQICSFPLGYGIAWYGRHNMKFPFMSPKDPARYENFPSRFAPLLKGQVARTAWHVTRANIYVALWLIAIAPLAASYGDTRMTVGIYRDPRTQDLATFLKGNFDRLRMNRANAQSQRKDGERSNAVAASPNEYSLQSYQTEQEFDAQPDLAGDNTFTHGNADTGVMSDQASQQSISQQRSPNTWSRAQARASRRSMEQTPESAPTPSGDIFFDDASPTAGNDPNMNTPQPYNRQQKRLGSSWDRVRRGDDSSANTRHSGGWRRSSPDQSAEMETRGDSFSFATGEEDKRLAKDQAQKEFDALLDRERRQGGSADYMRDMQATEQGEESNPSMENAWSRRRRG